jgi:isopentenyl diphosphate isomerase/L-lactate dehydrogenase-like FMN-dependent dehydrogenase
MDSILNYIEDLFPNNSKINKQNYENKIETLNQLKDRVPNSIDECINLYEIERLGIANLEINALSYYFSAANNEITKNRNRNFFNKILLNQKILRNVSITNLTTEVLGNKINLPICFSPSAIQKMAHEDGELATARSAYKNNTVMILSSLSSSAMEDVARENKSGIRWFQLYAMKNRNETANIIKEAEKYGFSAIVLTVDAPVMGYRDRDFQVKFNKPEKIQYEIVKKILYSFNKEENINVNINQNENLDNNNNNNTSIVSNIIPSTNSYTKSDIFELFKENIDSSLTWEYIEWIRKITNLPIIIKGVLNEEDAINAAKCKVNGIMVSNHGGRQLDTTPSTIEALGSISNILDKFYIKNPLEKKMEIYIDGGFSRGSDVLKALALGANAVFLGRPVIWGLAADGERGIDKTIEILKNELIIAMKLTGVNKIGEIDKSCLYDYRNKKPKF